jgi:hypothetical protein
MAKCRSRQRIDVIIPSGATHFRAFPCGERQANGGADSPVSKSVLSYFETPVSGGILARAVQDSSFQNMKRVEASAAFEEPWLHTRNGAPKVRRGLVGSFREDLSLADIEFLNGVFDL